jgi:molecular chaperone GrpE
MFDPTKTPEPTVGSGDVTPPEADSVTRSASVEESPPEPEVDGGRANETDEPADTPAEEAQEPATKAAPAAGEADVAAAEGGPASGPASEESEGGPRHDHVAALTAKADEYLGLAQRTKADFENYRKRAMREAAAAQERGAIKLAKALLPALDNLDRALAHAGDVAASDNGGATFVAGIEHVRADVIGALGHVGIEPYSPEGQPFDPQFHEAVAQQPFEGVQSGTVVEVYQRGYRLGDHVLRPARVVVAT